MPNFTSEINQIFFSFLILWNILFYEILISLSQNLQYNLQHTGLCCVLLMTWVGNLRVADFLLVLPVTVLDHTHGYLVAWFAYILAEIFSLFYLLHRKSKCWHLILWWLLWLLINMVRLKVTWFSLYLQLYTPVELFVYSYHLVTG